MTPNTHPATSKIHHDRETSQKKKKKKKKNSPGDRMARLAARTLREESSEDDFPALDELLKQPVKGEKISTKAEAKVGSLRKKGEIKEGSGEKVKKMVRKRVLNVGSENPLLRPLSMVGGRKESSTASEKSEKIPKANVQVKAVKEVKKKGAFESYLDAEREEQFGMPVYSKPSAPQFKLGGISKTTSSTRKDTMQETVIALDDDDLPKRTKARNERKARFSESEEESEIHCSESEMSDFIVTDSEEDSVVESPPPPPRSVRRLVKGRRPERQEDERLDLQMEKLNMGSDERSDERSDDAFTAPKLTPNPERKLKSTYTLQTSPEMDNPFTLRYSPPATKPRTIKQTRFTTPPGSPELKPRGLQSPTKLKRIPSTPHRPSMDSFWAQDVVNEWNDEYSPKKIPIPQPQPMLSPKKSPIKQDRIAKDAKKAFAQRKHEIAESFLIELDSKITNGKIAEMAASTGGIKIIWSKKLNTTAGRANWKRETIRSSTLDVDGKMQPTYRHHAAIELAEKVIDDEDRLLNVVAHEFCHLANFMVSNIKTNPHGKEFKAWASKVGRVFGDRGIEVTTKHSYEIEYKYVWECMNCGTEFKRHSKSIDVKRHQCGICKERLVQTKPVPKEGGEKGMGTYQAFVKENMKLVREENPGSPQKELMGLVGKKYQEFKAGKLKTDGDKAKVVDEVEVVIRKLDFLDLISP